jgi:ATP-dependent Clp protease ATP-binding subunit ClpA
MRARRVIFYARYEASQYGSPYIETEHLLLGLLREDAALTRRVLPSEKSIKSIRKKRTRTRQSKASDRSFRPTRAWETLVMF